MSDDGDIADVGAAWDVADAAPDLHVVVKQAMENEYASRAPAIVRDALHASLRDVAGLCAGARDSTATASAVTAAHAEHFARSHLTSADDIDLVAEARAVAHGTRDNAAVEVDARRHSSTVPDDCNGRTTNADATVAAA